MTLRVRSNLNLRHFSGDQLREIADALIINVESKEVRPVYFGINQPADTSLPWQQTDEFGNPIGVIKFYRAGGWR